jgi:acyl dehydratase
MPLRSFEDFTVGETAELGPLVVTADDIKAFAAAYDPQPMHLDENAAQNSVMGGLIASGLHTACLHMRLLVDGLLRHADGMGSPGLDEVRYLAPVRPGDRLCVHLEVIEMRTSKSRPEMGILKFRSLMTTDAGTAVLRVTWTLLLGRRAPVSA